MTKKALPFILLPLLLGLVAACATGPVSVTADPGPLYQIELRPLGPARTSRDGFTARFTFAVWAPDPLVRNALVQELQQTVTYHYENGEYYAHRLTLVEAFKLREVGRDSAGLWLYELEPGQNDHHSVNGLEDLPQRIRRVTINRKIIVYVANVHGADFSRGGFAHLPKNQRGDVVSDIPRGFNRRYQRSHKMRGQVHDSGRAGAMTYRITYTLVRRKGGDSSFIVDRHGGVGRVLAPEIIQMR